jgi:hypothetical protein
MNWQPIETAPKGADIWLYGLAEVWKGSMPFRITAQGSWDADCSRWMSTLYDDHGQIIYFDPSHWMPLPTPPEAE